MNVSTTLQRMVSLLSCYQKLVVSQLCHNELVGEYLTGGVESNVRLLCQMRTIIFLIKTAGVLEKEQLSLAETLYANAEKYYLINGCWLQQKNTEQEANLYSYAFVILAQSYLYKITKNPMYALALAETFSLIELRLQPIDVFKPLSESGCLEQNSAMHLYEALTFAFHEAQAVYMSQAIVQLELHFKTYFWQQSEQVLAEKISLTQGVLSFEAGHWFEWVTLLDRVEQWHGKVFLNKQALYSSALTKTSFTCDGFVINEMDNCFQPIDAQQVRIWPCLEFIRAKKIMEKTFPAHELSSFMNAFFNPDGLPKEYLMNWDAERVKSTTGYHIAESFIDIIDAFSRNKRVGLRDSLA